MSVTASYGWPKPEGREAQLELLLQEILDDIDADLKAAAGAVAWIAAPAFSNSWVNFGGAYQTAQYRKVGDRVELRGTVKNGTALTTIFTLPSGFRPPASQIFPCVSSALFGAITITSAGAVTQSVGSNTSVSLDGIAFSVTT